MKKHLNKTMVEFVLEQHTILIEPQSLYEQNQIRALRFEKILNYANALSQTPRLGHFIPCDENDVPLDEPLSMYYTPEFNCQKYPQELYENDCKKYQQACDRVLFEGFYIFRINERVSRVTNPPVAVFWYNLENEQEWSLTHSIKTYEDLIKYNLPLTDNGAKFFAL